MKKVIKDFGVAKALPAGVTATENTLWGIATAELTDSVGDVVRVEGVSWDAYHQPPTRYMKILASHLHALANGEPPVVGRVEQIMKSIMADGTPCVMFEMSWARDGQGNLTPLAKSYKDLYDSGYMDSFSIGFMVEEYEEMETGIDMLRTSLYEISPVAIPALPEANAIRRQLKSLGVEVAVKEAEECECDQQAPTSFDVEISGCEIPEVEKTRCGRWIRRDKDGSTWMGEGDHDDIVNAVVAGYQKVIEEHKAECPLFNEAEDSAAKAANELKELITQLGNQLKDINQAVTDAVSLIKGLTDRLDTLESAVVVLTNSRPSKAEHDTPDEDIEKSLNQVSKSLSEIKDFLRN